VLLQRFDNERAKARLINAKELEKMRDPEHDVRLQPGDMILVPRNKLSYVEPYVPIASLILLSPFAWAWAH
jgi:protein involved in polysaccharide export with SLBB domain